jgi:hypothetical protein
MIRRITAFTLCTAKSWAGFCLRKAWPCSSMMMIFPMPVNLRYLAVLHYWSKLRFVAILIGVLDHRKTVGIVAQPRGELSKWQAKESVSWDYCARRLRRRKSCLVHALDPTRHSFGLGGARCRSIV